MATFFTSDTHFGHTNVIKYSARPFSDVTHMNSEIVKRWQTIVKPEDTIIHVGDVTFTNVNHFQPIIDHLPGYKILIKGNHDRRWTNAKWHRVGFMEVHQELRLLTGHLSALLTHVPAEDVPSGCINVHGHVHETYKKRGSRINVGVDQWDYMPVGVDDIMKAMQEPDDSGYNVRFEIVDGVEIGIRD